MLCLLIQYMPYTIIDGFKNLKSNLEITDLQTSDVSTRQKNIRSVVENDLEVEDSFLTGSYSRNTLIAPLSEADIDIFIVLDSKYYYHYNNQNGGQAGLLDSLKRAIKKTYTKTPDISRNGQAITIQFTDFNVDVVPSFDRKGGGYIIPNSITQSWLSTDPKKHVELFADSNKTHRGDLVPIIKMIKAWNKGINNHFRSFHLETLAYSIFDRVTISDYPSGIRYFFDKGRDLIKKKNPDPAGYSEDVGNYIITKEEVEEAVGYFQRAFEIAQKSEFYAANSEVSKAYNQWSKIFKDYFPTYG